MRLELSTTPRAIWVWAPDEYGVAAVLAVLAAARERGRRVMHREAEFRVVDVDIGVNALAALGALAAAGHTFSWHPTQHPLNQQPHLYGIDVAPPLG